MSKHTPGPWEIRIREPQEVTLTGRAMVVTGGRDRHGVPRLAAYVLVRSGVEQAQTDAALLAAAPTLVAALRHVVAECTCCFGRGRVTGSPFVGPEGYECLLCTPAREALRAAGLMGEEE